jgi:hypothetical protein
VPPVYARQHKRIEVVRNLAPGSYDAGRVSDCCSPAGHVTGYNGQSTNHSTVADGHAGQNGRTGGDPNATTDHNRLRHQPELSRVDIVSPRTKEDPISYDGPVTNRDRIQGIEIGTADAAIRPNRDIEGASNASPVVDVANATAMQTSQAEVGEP